MPSIETYQVMDAGLIQPGDRVELEMWDDAVTPDEDGLVPHHVEVVVVLDRLIDYHSDAHPEVEAYVFVGYRPRTEERIGWTWTSNHRVGRVWRTVGS